LLVAATLPIEPGAVFAGDVRRDSDGTLWVGETPLPWCQGTAAMLGAAETVASHLGQEPPYALLGGDIGRGEGTRAVFAELLAHVDRIRPGVIAFHYLQPVMALMRKAVDDLAENHPEITLVADAGGMYAAKASGVASAFELMTPDVGELGFLADPEASHPAYVQHYLFGTDEFDPVALGRLAYAHSGARALLIKGKTDHIVDRGEVVAAVDSPCVPALEAIGGTGDTVTGLVSGFLAAGFPTAEGAVCAAKANREAGRVMQATPAKRAADLIDALPSVLADNLCEWGGACVS
jgi:NAD(P)H-hydrate repair Nnr-like enzyme with NAD(P)H-hydrate dehydratase domain